MDNTLLTIKEASEWAISFNGILKNQDIVRSLETLMTL